MTRVSRVKYIFHKDNFILLCNTHLYQLSGINGFGSACFVESLYSSKNAVGLQTICVTIIYKWKWDWFDTQGTQIEFILGFHIFYDCISATDGRKLISEYRLTLFELCRGVHN
jgi:hypothetical protein